MKKYLITNINDYLNENRLNKKDDVQYKNCYVSDLIRMEIVEQFFNNVEKNKNYNIESPNLFKLIDDWDGYDDQVYIQNNLEHNEFIFWEGWVKSCWDAAYLKDEYSALNKEEIIENIIKNRFNRIGEEFGYKIKEYKYFKHKNKYIMSVTFIK